jgi:tRNA threonylcarbamoyl adenosine modification protein YeaZ
MRSKKSPTLLAIDASDALCTIALQFNQYQVTDVSINNTNQQAAFLLPAIDNLLLNNNIKLQDIDAFVVSNGPGRFTGLRIATSCVQGLAYCTNKKVITINSLQLLAQQYINNNQVNINKTIWVCQKAYNSVFYQYKFYISVIDNQLIAGHVNLDDNSANNSVNNLAVSKNNLLEELTELVKNKQINNIYFAGNGWLEIFSVLFENKGLEKNSCSYSLYQEPINAKNIFQLANLNYFNKNLLNPFDVLPLYCVNPYDANSE